MDHPFVNVTHAHDSLRTESASQSLFTLRQLLVLGALSVIRYAERHGSKRPWLVQLMARRTTKIAAVALANKMGRMIWAIMTSGEAYREPQLRAA